MASQLLDMSCKQLRDKIAGGEVKSVEAVEAVFEAIEKYDGTVGAFLSTFKERSLERAKLSDEKISKGEKLGELEGVPVAIKDNMCSVFGRTTCGSKMLENFESPYNGAMVEKLEAAGAVIIGKLNMDEFAMGSSTENSALCKTVNPWDVERVPGGSSGGSAAAVASRQVWTSLGSDTGGSIRQPASLCGVVGLKPTYGRVSRFGLVAYGSSLDQIGPFARNVEDAALMLNVISGYDDRDSTSVKEEDAPVVDYTARINEPVDGLKIAVIRHLNDGAEPEVKAAIDAAIESYKSSGAEIVEVEMPHFDYSIATYYVVATAEASSNLARYDGVHYGHRSSNIKEYTDVYFNSRAEGFGDEVKRRIMLGNYALSAGYYDAYYLKALKVRNLIRGDFNKVFEGADVILMPVSPCTAFKFGEKTEDPLQMYLADMYTIAVNLAGVPGVSVPCGFDGKGLPVGMQLIGPAFSEEKLLRIARMYEAEHDWCSKKPSLID